MSVVAPTRTIPSPLRIPEWGASQNKSQMVGFPFKDAPMTPLSPPIPTKSPERKKFFPLPTSASSEEKKYTLKTLPNTPTNPFHSHDQTPSYPPLNTPSIARSNTRLLNVSTAVESVSSGTASPSPSANISAPFPPPPNAVHTASSPLKRVPTTTSNSAIPAVQTRARSQSTTSQSCCPQTGTTQLQFQPSSTSLPNTSTQHSSNTNPLTPQTPNQTSTGTKQPQTTTQRLREGAFFAFVLLPLSCWYTRGGKRLKDLDMREVEEGRDARARANAIAHGRSSSRARESDGYDEMRTGMPLRASVSGKVGKRTSLDGRDGIPGTRERERQVQMKKLSSDDLGMRRVKTFTTSETTPDFRKQKSRFDMRRNSFDDVGARRRAGSLGASGIGNGSFSGGNGRHERSRSLKQHPVFDFERERVPLVRRTTTASAIIRELTPGRTI